jgi:hypothetical protein
MSRRRGRSRAASRRNGDRPPLWLIAVVAVLILAFLARRLAAAAGSLAG